MLNDTPILSSTLDGVDDAIFNVFNITSVVGEGEDKITKVNLDIMKTYLDCKVITKDDAIKIIDTGKLNSINGIKEFVNKY